MRLECTATGEREEEEGGFNQQHPVLVEPHAITIDEQGNFHSAVDKERRNVEED